MKNIMIKDLLSLAAGTQIKGLALLIKTARTAFPDSDDNRWQEVVFMDASAEITAHILIGENEPLWKSKQNVCIMEGEIQDTDERKKESVKIVITECFDTAPQLGYDQIQDLQAEDWKKLRQDEIKGKIRHGLCCSLIKRIPADQPINPSPKYKKVILEWQDFVMNGE